MMTEEEINNAIARHVGAKQSVFYDWSGPGTDSWYQWPSYCVDLNEMHRVEELLTDDQCDQYGLHLNNLRVGDPLDEAALDLCDWHATARQRAEAFLRTVGKWKE